MVRSLALATAIAFAIPLKSSSATWYFPGTNTNQPPLRFRAIAAGAVHSLAIESNGVVVAWGDNFYGECDVPAGVRGARALAGGYDFSLALTSDGRVVGWGDNYHGQISIPPGLTDVMATAAAGYHSLALMSSGEVVAWGDNVYGESSVPSDLTNAVAIAAEIHHSLAIRSDGTVKVWGASGYPLAPPGLSNVVAIAAGWDYSLALKTDGTIVGWGSSRFDETTFPSRLSGIAAIASCQSACLALKSDGTVVAWGYSHAVPAGLSNVVAIAAGGYHSLALRSDGSIVAWGDTVLLGAQSSVVLDVPTNNTADVALQDTVDAARAGDTILVAPGQYTLSRPVVITNAIALRSTAGPDQTLLSVRFNNYGLFVSNSEALIEGFAMSWYGAFSVGATIQDCLFSSVAHRDGSAVFMIGGTLSNSVVTYYRSTMGGGSAVYCRAAGLITDCNIVGTGWGTGDGIGLELEDSEVRNTMLSGLVGPNEMSYGPALYAVSSVISGCSITHNASPGQGGGAYLNSCFMDRCLVTGNFSRGDFAGEGGGGLFETNSVIRNSLIVSNSAEHNGTERYLGTFGGGVYMQGGALLNCTISHNSAIDCQTCNPPQTAHGAGVYIESGAITNCIISSNFFAYGSPALDYEWYNAGSAIFDDCCTTPDPGGVGNIIQDPLFLAPTNGNFHLATNSPCLGAGMVQDWMAGALDLDGNPRIPASGMVDMGAYQSQSALAPQLQAELLIRAVNDLVSEGTLNRDQGDTLTAKLQAAEDSINAGRFPNACRHVDAFMNQVQALVRRGILTQTQGQSIIDAADRLKTAIGC